jgi:hypothetical protein
MAGLEWKRAGATKADRAGSSVLDRGTHFHRRGETRQARCSESQSYRRITSTKSSIIAAAASPNIAISPVTAHP